MITNNSLIQFTNPNADEIGLVMLVLEVNGDRLLVECLVGMEINPTTIVLLSDVELAE